VATHYDVRRQQWVDKLVAGVCALTAFQDATTIAITREISQVRRKRGQVVVLARYFTQFLTVNATKPHRSNGWYDAAPRMTELHRGR
jgi:hypothetical protein